MVSFLRSVSDMIQVAGLPEHERVCFMEAVAQSRNDFSLSYSTQTRNPQEVGVAIFDIHILESIITKATCEIIRLKSRNEGLHRSLVLGQIRLLRDVFIISATLAATVSLTSLIFKNLHALRNATCQKHIQFLDYTICQKFCNTSLPQQTTNTSR